MTSQRVLTVRLTQDDVPGAKFNNGDVESHSVAQLRRWLQCRGLKCSGNRPALVERCKQAIATDIQIDLAVDHGKWYSLKLARAQQSETDYAARQSDLPPVLPISGWKAFSSDSVPIFYNYGHIYHYLLESINMVYADGGSSVEDLAYMTAKPLRKGKQFAVSNVQNVQFTERTGHYFLKAKVLPSMVSAPAYDVTATLSIQSGSVRDASCSCKASALGRCSHVGGLLQFVLAAVQDENKHSSPSCTDLPCAWGQGTKHKNPQKVHEARYASYAPSRKSELYHFDPRPPQLRSLSNEESNNFVCSLQRNSARQGAVTMWETLLTVSYTDYELDTNRRAVLLEQVCTLAENLKGKRSGPACVPSTIGQSESEQWFLERSCRITASVAKEAMTLGADLARTEHATRRHRFLRKLLGLDPALQTSHMLYGLKAEKPAQDEYQQLRPGCSVVTTGLWVNPDFPMLGCSPDALINEPQYGSGLLEIKALKLLQEFAPADLPTAATQDDIVKNRIQQSCFFIASDHSLQLRNTHQYYHQIQFQLAVTNSQWCDFMLWSSKGVSSIQRITRNEQLIQNLVENCRKFWLQVVAPEIFEMRVPRGLDPFIL